MKNKIDEMLDSNDTFGKDIDVSDRDRFCVLNREEIKIAILSLFEKTMQNAEDEIADYIDDAESEGDIQIYIKGNEISKDIINIIKDKIKEN